MSFWWLDPEFGLFLLFLLTMIWGILLTYAIMIKESINMDFITPGDSVHHLQDCLVARVHRT